MMNDCLIGYTGLVGSNLDTQHYFKHKFNSKNIGRLNYNEYDTVVCSGISAVKWWANDNPEEDWKRIEDLILHLRNIRCNKFILISTIDVYKNTVNLDETSETCDKTHHAYGYNRKRVEDIVMSDLAHLNPTIIRLPGLFGKGLKKNIIFDLLNENLQGKINGFDAYQWYDLSDLFSDIISITQKKLRIVNLFSEPVLMKELLEEFFPNIISGKMYMEKPSSRVYNNKSMHYVNGYAYNKKEIMNKLNNYINSTL